MPALAFAAHAATDLLDIVGHNLVTGDGPATPFVPGGASGGLTSGTSYWVIAIDADHVKLAASQADALAGTPVVDITSDVSGVLGIGVPYRQARTYALGVQVKSVDLNGLQAAVERLFAMPPIGIHHSSFTGTSGAATAIVHTSAGYSTLSASGNFYRGLDLKAGQVIESATFFYNRKGAGTVTPRIQRQELATGTVTAVIAGSADNSSADAIQEVTLSASSHEVEAGYAYFLAVAATDTGNRLYGASLSVRESL